MYIVILVQDKSGAWFYASGKESFLRLTTSRKNRDWWAYHCDKPFPTIYRKLINRLTWKPVPHTGVTCLTRGMGKVFYDADNKKLIRQTAKRNVYETPFCLGEGVPLNFNVCYLPDLVAQYCRLWQSSRDKKCAANT